METSRTPLHKPLAQPPLNATFIGTVVGTAQHYALPFSALDFFCESGFAFALNIHIETCPSGPYCWNHARVLTCLRNLGLAGTHIPLQHPEGAPVSTHSVEEQARAAVQDAVLSIEALEHQIVTGSDEYEFKLALPWGPNVPSCMSNLPYKDLHRSDPPVFGFYRFDQCEAATQKTRLREGLKCALSMYRQPTQFQQEGYAFGIAAYKNWIAALQSGNYDKQGHWWNAMVWAECRSHAAEYFKNWPHNPTTEANELASLFSKISELLIQSGDNELSDAKKIGLIEQASELEQRVPPVLQRIVDRLGDEQ